MKAVIVEIKDNVAAMLSEDGRVSKIRNKNYFIGQEIKLKDNNKYIKLAVSAAAALMLLATPAWAYLTPYSYVSLDINPSFEFSINRFDRVLEARAVNNDGEKIVEKINIAELKNKEIKEAVKNVLVELKDQGYILEGKEGGVVIATSSKNQEKTDELAASLRTMVEEEIEFDTGNDSDIKQDNKEEKEEEKKEEKETKNTEDAKSSEESPEKEETDVKSKDAKETNETNETKQGSQEEAKQTKETARRADKAAKSKFSVEVIEVSQDDVKEAKELDVTPGKYNLVKKLQECAEKTGDKFGKDEIDFWLKQPVKSIMGEIEECNGTERQAKKSQKNNVKNEEKYKEEADRTQESGKPSGNRNPKK